VDFSNDLSAFATHPPSLRSVFQLGFPCRTAPADLLSNLPIEQGLKIIIVTAKPHLADYHLPNPVIKAYATTFYLKRKFVLARTENRD
jgi:hypothetical protein